LYIIITTFFELLKSFTLVALFSFLGWPEDWPLWLICSWFSQSLPTHQATTQNWPMTVLVLVLPILQTWHILNMWSVISRIAC